MYNTTVYLTIGYSIGYPIPVGNTYFQKMICMCTDLSIIVYRVHPINGCTSTDRTNLRI